MDAEKKILSISSILEDKNSSLSALYKKANSYQEIDRQIKSFLDPSLKTKFELANINADTAIILVSSSAWATRLRYNIPDILKILNKQLHYTSIKTIRIKIKKALNENPVANKNPAHLSDNSANFLNDVANNFSDPELRDCIIKLSKHKL